MSESAYLEFEMHIRRRSADGTHPVSVHVPGEDRRAEGVFQPPYTDPEISDALGWMEQGLFDDTYVKQFGAKLFRALFIDDIKEVYNGSRQSSNGRLRIRLIIDAPAVARVPWELLYDPNIGEFLALDGPFVRGASLTEPTRPYAST